MTHLMGYMMDMTAAAVRNQMKFTLLHRPNGAWSDDEVSNLINKLDANVDRDSGCPQYLVLHGHFSQEKTLEILGDKSGHTSEQVTGLYNDKLPFKPSR